MLDSYHRDMSFHLVLLSKMSVTLDKNRTQDKVLFVIQVSDSEYCTTEG